MSNNVFCQSSLLEGQVRHLNLLIKSCDFDSQKWVEDLNRTTISIRNLQELKPQLIFHIEIICKNFVKIYSIPGTMI